MPQERYLVHMIGQHDWSGSLLGTLGVSARRAVVGEGAVFKQSRRNQAWMPGRYREPDSGNNLVVLPRKRAQSAQATND